LAATYPDKGHNTKEISSAGSHASGAGFNGPSRRSSAYIPNSELITQ
jgi:hypothetical protein